MLDLNCIILGGDVKYKKFLNLFNQFYIQHLIFLKHDGLWGLIARNSDH